MLRVGLCFWYNEIIGIIIKSQTSTVRRASEAEKIFSTSERGWTVSKILPGMRKLPKDILERAIKSGMKSEGYFGKTLDRRAVEALRGAKLGKLLNKKDVDQRQVFAALEALKKKGLISERVNEKNLVKKSMAEERKNKRIEAATERQEQAVKERLQERTARGYLAERQKEEGQDYGSIRKSISQEGEGEKRIHLGNEKPEVKSTGWARPEPRPETRIPESRPPEEPKDLPI